MSKKGISLFIVSALSLCAFMFGDSIVQAQTGLQFDQSLQQTIPPTATPAPDAINSPGFTAPTIDPNAAAVGSTLINTATEGHGKGDGGSTIDNRPQHENISNCDACGYCTDLKGNEVVPDRWVACRQCLYPGLTSDNPRDNLTIRDTGGIGVPSPHQEMIYTDFGCFSTLPGRFAGQLATVLFYFIGGIAFIVFLYGVAIVATSSANPNKIREGRRIIYGAVIGLLFALFAVTIIQFVSGGLGLDGLGF